MNLITAKRLKAIALVVVIVVSLPCCGPKCRVMSTKTLSSLVPHAARLQPQVRSDARFADINLGANTPVTGVAFGFTEASPPSRSLTTCGGLLRPAARLFQSGMTSAWFRLSRGPRITNESGRWSEWRPDQNPYPPDGKKWSYRLEGHFIDPEYATGPMNKKFFEFGAAPGQKDLVGKNAQRIPDKATTYTKPAQ